MRYSTTDPDYLMLKRQVSDINENLLLVTGSPFGPNGFSIKLKDCNEYCKTEMSFQDVCKFIKEN